MVSIDFLTTLSITLKILRECYKLHGTEYSTKENIKRSYITVMANQKQVEGKAYKYQSYRDSTQHQGQAHQLQINRNFQSLVRRLCIIKLHMN